MKFSKPMMIKTKVRVVCEILGTTRTSSCRSDREKLVTGQGKRLLMLEVEVRWSVDGEGNRAMEGFTNKWKLSS